MELRDLRKLIKIPDLTGLPNLDSFQLWHCPCLEEIHPSIGRLERLSYISIEECPRLRMFPSITRIKKLETLEFGSCKKLEIMLEIQQQDMGHLSHLHLNDSGKEVAACSSSGIECRSPHYNLNRRRLWFSHSALRKLDLSKCNLGDEEIGSDVWDLPNLEELDLSHNPFSRLDFGILRLPLLKWLKVSFCKGLVELSELPSSIAVVRADGCYSLESFGDISNCKWLWNVSLDGVNKLGHLRGDTLTHSMLQGNAIEDHFISVALQLQFPNMFVGRLSRGYTCKLHLPNDWYNDFCGFLICIVTQAFYPRIKIIIKQEDPRFDISQESDDAMQHIYDGHITCIGYISFSSLRHTALLTSSYNIISFTVEDKLLTDVDSYESTYVGTELIPRKSKSDGVQTTDCSEFWDKRFEDAELDTFTIQQCHSESSIQISWNPVHRGWFA